LPIKIDKKFYALSLRGIPQISLWKII